MRIYLDVSCLNRPFDDQSQGRDRLEADAVTIILQALDAGQHEQTSSRMAEIEITAISDDVRRRRVQRLLPEAIMGLTPEIFGRAADLVDRGLAAADAVHVAAAETAGADVFLTCDDRLLRQCQRLKNQLRLRAANPVDWVKEQFDESNAG
jgi:predicted nucleic acid-binding protein